MIRRVALAAIAGAGLANGLYLDRLPPWRQVLFVGLAVAAYLHGRHLHQRRDGLLLVVAAAPAGAFLRPEFWNGAGALVVVALVVVLPWLAGCFRGQQAELVLAGRERVVRLEREREMTAERARLQERARIATDMHDSLGHELALIALRAGALELSADLSERNRETAAQLRESAVTATDRLRHTVGLLREASPGFEPPDESVAALVSRAREAGLTVELDAAATTTGAWPTLVNRAAHRVVQEALTNAARHAPGAQVLVRMDHSDGAVVVTVIDSGSASADRPAGDGSGLAGLRERVRLLGGTLSAGPHNDGFTVVARLPCRSGDQETEAPG
ncbi:sensor histidine kinase [Paractinoplanes maris]|uniref:sensor histidine kinase n=1 Tax=Paractinoplanes maris TaxID=1734446 RepID=UPI002020A3E7|nr:histidine kinase [Actinoplanes maris]